MRATYAYTARQSSSVNIGTASADRGQPFGSNPSFAKASSSACLSRARVAKSRARHWGLV